MNSTASHPNTTTEINEPIQAFRILGEIFNLLLLTATLWILGVMIVYGTKNKRWKKSSGSSSLNSGVAYVSCVIVVFATITKLIFSAVLFHMPEMMDTTTYCELVMDIDNGITCAVLVCIYFFLWIRQKLIYLHPSVLPLAGQYVKVASWLSALFLAIIFVIIGLYFTVPESYVPQSHGCVGRPLNDLAITSIHLTRGAGFGLLALVFILAQVTLLSLYMYPMFRNDVVLDEARKQDGGFAEDFHATSVFTTCRRIIAGYPSRLTIPVTIIIRRSVIGCLITCAANLIATLLAGLASEHIPQSMIDPLVNLALFAALVSCIWSFGNNREFLIVCCVSCRVSIRTQKMTRYQRRSQSLHGNEEIALD
ncbi:uncharacterized protein LOC144424941 [Styela clava]